MDEIKTSADIRLLAMAYPRSVAETKITELALHFSKHLLCMLLFPESSYTKGWNRELHACFDQMQQYGLNLKKGKKFNASEIYSFILPYKWRTESRIDSDVETLVEEYTKIKRNRLANVDVATVRAEALQLLKLTAEAAAANAEWRDVQKHFPTHN
jgi:hypothetical protein